MDLKCAICLDELTLPVATPCGHVHCKKCLYAHIKSGKDATKSTCPTCRAPFHIVMPDLDYLPEKLHQFIMPSVRRIYLDVDQSPSPSPTSLLRKIAALEYQKTVLEARTATQTRDINLLMNKCESNMAASRVHAERERTARLDNEKLKVELAALKKHVEEVEVKYNKILQSLSKSLAPGPSTPAVKRKSSQEFAPETSSINFSMRKRSRLISCASNFSVMISLGPSTSNSWNQKDDVTSK